MRIWRLTVVPISNVGSTVIVNATSQRTRVLISTNGPVALRFGQAPVSALDGFLLDGGRPPLELRSEECGDMVTRGITGWAGAAGVVVSVLEFADV